MVMMMDDFEKMLIIFAVFALFICTLVGMVVWKIGPPQQVNESMHNVMESEQRNLTTGGAGIPGGSNPYLATTLPLPTIRPK
jgi:hypothetical protein